MKLSKFTLIGCLMVARFGAVPFFFSLFSGSKRLSLVGVSKSSILDMDLAKEVLAFLCLSFY
jgi:hypothetical protein